MDQSAVVGIVHVDVGLVVLDKPGGMEVQVTRTSNTPNLVDWWSTQNEGEVLRPVHRLDLRGSGLVVLARDQEHAAGLSLLFRERKVSKRYAVRLWGALPSDHPKSLRVSVGLEKRDGRAWVDEHGRESLSIFEIQDYKDGVTEALVRTETGRFHQVRAHAAFLGCPIVGDVRYGARAADRLYLHACELEFLHPSRNEWLEFQSPAPWSG